MRILDVFKNKPKRSRQYLIEIRFSGFVKDSMRDLKEAISKNFHVSQRKIIPHVTLAGPIYTDDEKRLVKEVVKIAKKYDLISLQLDGFGHFDKDVIFVKIKPSPELESLRLEIVNNLKEFCDLSEFDVESDFQYHATLVMRDVYRKFNRIWDFLQSWKIPEIKQHVVRISIINENRKILNEYDFMLNKLLNCSEALDKNRFQRTLSELENIRKSTEEQFTKEFIDVTRNGGVYVFSDAHFDHANIIRYCNRPFNSLNQMNQRLKENWNNTVKEHETVFYLGDLTFGRGRHPIDYWLGHLNGEKNFIRGNHDTDIITRANVIHTRYGIKYENYEFLLSHSPYRPFGYDGWIIHGDKHNNSIDRYPFINQEKKTINVSAEMINYTPLSLSKLIPLLESGKNYDTIIE